MVDPRGTGPTPRVPAFSEPLSPVVQAWINELAKAAKGMRVYAENNEMLHKYVDKAYEGLTALLAQVPELHLSIREDRILFGKDAVHINADREEGLPFIFYRNAFRRVTLVQGMEREELLKLLRAIVTDYKGYNAMGDDLVTTLWRYALPHLRYLTIDAISSTDKNQVNTLEREELERIQGNIEDIVAAIYKTNAEDDDIVAGVSITKEDLEALKDIRQESDEDLDMLDHATSRAIADISSDEIDAVEQSLILDTRDHLTNEMLDILVRILFKETSSRASGPTIDLLQRLFDSLVLAQEYQHAMALIERLRDVAENAENMQEMHISRHLLRLFASESRVLPVLNALNDGYSASSVTDMMAFLRALGPPIAPVVLGSLEIVASPAHRRMLCEMIVDFGVPEVKELMRVSENAKWFVVRDILGLAQRFPLEKISILIKQALAHDHPKVRAYAVGMLRGYARGLADQLIVERLQDPDLDVRLSAIRVAAARRSIPAGRALHEMLSAEDLSDWEPRELRMAMAAYATIAGTDAVALLDHILNPGFFATLKSTDPQVAAAFALASLGGAATEALSKGARSLNSKVRDACKRALSRELGKGESNEELLAARIPAASTTNPGTPLPTLVSRIPGAKSNPTQTTTGGSNPPGDADPAPFAPNAADVEFMAYLENGDPLENAPPFYLYDPTVGDTDAPVQAPHAALFKPRPEMSKVMTPYPQPDRVPENLPPAPAVPVEAPAPPRTDDGYRPIAPPSAAGIREEMPAMFGAHHRPPPPKEEAHEPLPRAPSWVEDAMANVEPEDELVIEAPSIELADLSDKSAGELPPPAPALPRSESGEMSLELSDLSDLSGASGERAPRSRRSPSAASLPSFPETPRAPSAPRPSPFLSAVPDDEPPGFDDDEEDEDDIPSASDVVASLFADADLPAEGGQPLDADHVTGDIRTTDDAEVDDALAAPFIPTVDSDPFAPTDGQLPPPRSRTWSGSTPSEPVAPVIPWVDDLVLDDDKGGGD